MSADTLYYVLREGSTREEQWTWDEIEDLCRAGELSPKARIFLVDEDRWAPLAETRLATVAGQRGRAAVAGDDEARTRLEAEYQAALDRAAVGEDVLEALLDAGSLAAQLGNKDEAREHFQRVLEQHPYHVRAAQEIKRRFSRSEQRSFRYLQRPAPAWEDLGGAAAMPFGRGPLYVLVPAAVFAGLSFLPFGWIATVVLAYIWAFQAMEYTARGSSRPPEWNRALQDPMGKLLRPAGLMAAVVLQWGVLIGGVAWGMRALERNHSVSIWGYLAGSPIFVVVAWVAALLYLPAAMASIGGFSGPVTKTLDPSRLVKSVARMEHEYVYTVLLLAVITGVVALVRALTAGLPVAGEVIFALTLAYAIPLAGLILGRLLGRTAHLIS